MRELRIEGVHKRAFRTTTDSNHRFPVAPNVLMRDFDVNEPDTAWATDITYRTNCSAWEQAKTPTTPGLFTHSLAGVIITKD